ncbi:MAG TPA: class I SAM-dependent methyltransferase [Thermoanaerobaculia bacterium]
MRAAFDFWDRESGDPTHISWLASAEVRRYINRSISGDEERGALDWFQRQFPRRFGRGLSIGCGAGALERDLIRRGICERIDAFDGSLASLSIARREAVDAGLAKQVHYFVADFNDPSLPEQTYDIVFVHQAVHHVTELERLYAAIVSTLRDGGLLYIDEYVGPSRFDWDEALIRPHRAVYDGLPERTRAEQKLLLPIQPDDPSEAVRSSEIIDRLKIGFRILAQRDYGGNLLSVLFPVVDWSEAQQDLVATLIRQERTMLAEGAAPYHTVVVAQPVETKAEALLAYARAARWSRCTRAAKRVIRAVTHFGRRIEATLRRRAGVALATMRRRPPGVR